MMEEVYKNESVASDVCRKIRCILEQLRNINNRLYYIRNRIKKEASNGKRGKGQI